MMYLSKGVRVPSNDAGLFLCVPPRHHLPHGYANVRSLAQRPQSAPPSPRR